jgi:hypothetical protein
LFAEQELWWFCERKNWRYTSYQQYSIDYFTSGSNTVSIKGVANQVTNFERTNPGTVTTLFDTPFTATYSATTITNLFKVTDPTDKVNGDSYIAVVNSGNTLLFMGAPTTTSTDNAICQLM